jgi:hypothetical protein
MYLKSDLSEAFKVKAGYLTGQPEAGSFTKIVCMANSIWLIPFHASFLPGF